MDFSNATVAAPLDHTKKVHTGYVHATMTSKGNHPQMQIVDGLIHLA